MVPLLKFACHPRPLETCRSAIPQTRSFQASRAAQIARKPTVRFRAEKQTDRKRPFAVIRGEAICFLMADLERLWHRYWSIRDDHGNGHRMPILRHLALRHDTMAMTELADEVGRPGNAALPSSSSGLYYRAYRAGYTLAAQHLAMDAFNRRDLGGYRRWLARAARSGDADAARELRRFETRLPHANARLIGRQRPHRESDFA